MDIPAEERFFKDDGTSLDWLEEPIQEQEPQGQDAVEGKGDSPIPDNMGQGKAQQQKPDLSTTQSEGASHEIVSEPKTLMDIKQNYTLKFKNLERTYQGKIIALVGQAKSEYIAMKNGQLDATAMSLASKYMGMVKSMESEADAQFYHVLSQMEQDLINRGFPTDLVKTAELEYEQRKKNQRAAIIQKFADKL